MSRYRPPTTPGSRFITPAGHERLQAELEALWKVERPRVTQAIQQQAAEMAFAPPFQMGHPKAFELAERVVQIAPAGMGKVFFANSGSEAVETALATVAALDGIRKG
jgi:beta-alanine--pyruvate transaminase